MALTLQAHPSKSHAEREAVVLSGIAGLADAGADVLGAFESQGVMGLPVALHAHLVVLTSMTPEQVHGFALAAGGYRCSAKPVTKLVGWCRYITKNLEIHTRHEHVLHAGRIRLPEGVRVRPQPLAPVARRGRHGVVQRQDHACLVCGAAIVGRSDRATCSGACRKARSRQKLDTGEAVQKVTRRVARKVSTTDPRPTPTRERGGHTQRGAGAGRRQRHHVAPFPRSLTAQDSVCALPDSVGRWPLVAPTGIRSGAHAGETDTHDISMLGCVGALGRSSPSEAPLRGLGVGFSKHFDATDPRNGATYHLGRPRLPGDLFDAVDDHDADLEPTVDNDERNEGDDWVPYDVDQPGATSPAGIDDLVSELIR